MRNVVAVVLIVFGSNAARADEPKRLAVPDAADVAEIEKTIRSVFAADFAKKNADDQVEFAKKLLKEAADTNDNPAGKFVLLREAHSLAARGGDFELAARAGQEFAARFNLDAVKSRWDFLDVVAAGPFAPGSNNSSANFFLTSALEAVQSDDYESASKILKLATASAKTAKNTALTAALAERGKTLAAIQDEAKRLKPDLDAWRATGAGTDQLGRFLCFYKGSWAKGLPVLAKSTDAAIQAIAVKDLANPKTATAQLAVAEGWWTVAAAQPKLAQPGIKSRASYWYQQAVGELTGFSKARAESNIAEAESLAFERFHAPGQPGTAPKVTAAKVEPKVVEKAVPKDKTQAYVFLFQPGPNAKTGTQRVFEPQGKGKWEMHTEFINLEDKVIGQWLEKKSITYVEMPAPRNELLLRATIGTGLYKITPNGMFTYREKTSDWYQYPGSGEWVSR